MAAQALLADIGGTNTRIALAQGGRLVAGSTRRYHNADFDALEPVLHRYIAETGCGRPQAACLAMAGPVREGAGQLTNLDWTLNTDLLAEATGARTVALLNDLQAQGHALGHLPPGACDTIRPGTDAGPDVPRLVIGVGTGFNAAPVFEAPGGRFVPPAEAGHVLLPLRDAQMVELAHYVTAMHGFCAVENVLSGRGLGTIHQWVVHTDGHGPTRDSTAVMAAFAQGDPQAVRTLALFAKCLGTVAGDLALNQLPFGGLFLIGGMSRAMAPHLMAHGFGQAFRDKGRFSTFMDQFPVSVITDDDAALIGSAQYLQAKTAQA